jgi:hypothetical protein
MEPLVNENRQLRRELGHLILVDRTKVNVVRAEFGPEPNTWRWRVYVPPDAVCTVNVFSGHLPPNADPFQTDPFYDAHQSGNGIISSYRLAKGEFRLDVRLFDDGRRWVLNTNPGGNHAIDEFSDDWLSRSFNALFPGLTMQHTLDPGDAIPLMYIAKPVIDEAARQITIPTGDTEGIYIWIKYHR